MIPDHVVTLILVLVAGWIIFRWGEIIFLGHALFYYWTEQWELAGVSFAFAWVLSSMKAVAMAVMRAGGFYNGRWL